MIRFVEVAVPLPLKDTFTYEVPAELATGLQLGARVRIPFGRRRLVGYVVRFAEQTDLKNVKALESVIDAAPILTAPMLELAAWIASYYACSLGEALRAMLPTKANRQRGKRRGLVAASSQGAALLEHSPPATLNTYQTQVVGDITAGLDSAAFGAYLLHGVTGSGKTEVYLHAIQKTLQRGRAAILLIPEIALTPQTADRFRARLGTDVGILHSGMTLAERHDVLAAAATGEIQVILGARSAVFAPFRNLGLIVVDEEQESSYKQGEKPRYHARSVALMRGKIEGATVVLGSATPSLESFQNTVAAKHQRLEIPERVDSRPLARVHLVDMRGDENRNVVLSQPLLDALAHRVEVGEQSIVLLNRRGHSNFVQCFACGELVRCPSCDISLTYHSTGHELRCHYCNHRRDIPESCPKCSNPCQVFRGVGTQRLEQDLAGQLPGARILRMDFDTTSKRGAHRAILETFGAGKADILLGTQMVAKGHDFPGVTLVGVVQADAGLSLPDFRAAERTFHLLAQVAGRAGRGERPGDVYIQTMCPDHYTIALAARQDYRAFFDHEAELRRSLGYPPFKRLMAITGLGAHRGRLSHSMRQIAASLRNPGLGSGVQVLGPAESAIPRLKGRYREQILIKGSLGEATKGGLVELLSQVARGHPGVEFQVDVDPVNMM